MKKTDMKSVFFRVALALMAAFMTCGNRAGAQQAASEQSAVKTENESEASNQDKTIEQVLQALKDLGLDAEVSPDPFENDKITSYLVSNKTGEFWSVKIIKFKSEAARDQSHKFWKAMKEGKYPDLSYPEGMHYHDYWYVKDDSEIHKNKKIWELLKKSIH